MEGVELETRHQVDVALDEGHRLEVAADVEVESPPREARRVGDRHRGEARRADVLLAGRVHELLERDEPIEAPGIARR